MCQHICFSYLDLLLTVHRCSAAGVKASPLNTNDLFSRLAALADNSKPGEVPDSSQRRKIRSPTSSPAPETNNHQFERFCYDELVKAGGRPVVSCEQLFNGWKDADGDRETLTPWLGTTASDGRDDDVPPIFSTQLEDWETFQQKWQWDNRGKYAGEEGFSAFLGSQRREFLHKGEDKWVSNPMFEDTIRSVWKHEPRYLELPGKQGFDAYAHAVQKRLASHNFTQPFRLVEDPRRQDAQTTWVEYLSYVYWWQDWHAVTMRATEPQNRKAWDKLELMNAKPPPQPHQRQSILLTRSWPRLGPS